MTRRIVLPLDRQCAAAGLPVPIAEYLFHSLRLWRFDWVFLNLHQPLAVEIEGGIWIARGGRHTRGAGFEKDLEKYAEATILGWRVLRVSTGQVASGQALGWIERLLR